MYFCVTYFFEIFWRKIEFLRSFFIEFFIILLLIMVINNSDIVNKLTFYIIFSNINFPPSLVKKYQLVL